MDKVMEMFVLLQVRMAGLRDRERGQGTLEYVGMIIVAAILVVAVLEVADVVDLGAAFQEAVESVTNGGGGGE